ncbi:MAG: hypothetical protein RLZZ612_1047 [Pseudomonadota bacterium]|jgi:pyruvate/2-oxoglutarate dehydrogenase complex dihydrolipoamide dehydrogenase (E3) component/uncharacterized membrane protein YdjX (TVP38/TMEM64 family)
MRYVKLGVALGLVAAVVGFVALGGTQWLSLARVQAQVGEWQALRDAQPLLASALYVGLYVLVTALSLPGAAVLTLVGGALFGLLWGLVLVSFASTVGATLAFLAARFVLRDWVQARFGRKLQAMQVTQAEHLGLSLFTLRLVPAVPFFLLNLLMGLLPIRTWTYIWVSQLGMLPGTVVYVNAGTQLGQLQSLQGLMSPAILGSFVLLGVFPWLAKAALQAWQRRRVYAGWQRPARFDRNLIVIGAGAAGLVTAYIAAAVKAKVTLIEAHQMGGDCLNTGCVPSKALIRSAKLAHQMRHASRYGLADMPAHVTPVSFKAVMARVQAVIAAIAPHDSIERYTALGVEVLQGHARLVDPWTVEISIADGHTQRLTARSIVLATGARPFIPPLPGLDQVRVLTSDTVWQRMAEWDAPPQHLVILGGGPIGCELAQALARLGVGVTLVERSPRLLMREDEAVSQHVAAALAQDGVRVLTTHHARRVEVSGAAPCLIVTDAQSVELRLPFEELLCAVGRVARLEGYGLEALGISAAAHGRMAVNAYLETRYPHIYAAGDVVGPYQFTHVAAHQAWYAAVNGLFGRFKRFAVDERVIPHCTFTDPEVARVGLNESEAQAQGVAYELTRYELDDLDRAIADSAAHGFVQVLTVPGKDRILGVTIVGEHAGDLLAEYVLAMKHGLGLNAILGTIHSYPTLAEANKYAAGQWKRAHAPEGVLAWVRRYHDWMRG